MIALILAVLFVTPQGHADAWLTAPVYAYRGDRAVLEHIGTHRYQAEEGYSILYCIAGDKMIMQCVMHTPDDQLVLIDQKQSEIGV